MDNISNEEYSEIKDFLRPHVLEINKSENADRQRERIKKSKYSLPNADAFGWMPAKNICYSVDVGANRKMYVIPFLSFHTFLLNILPNALQAYPNLFSTGNAHDVMSAIYKVSLYEKMGNINEYQQYLIDYAYCYFLLRDKSGELCNRIFRLDLFRHILPKEGKNYEFNGGLMHAFSHCSFNGIGLSSGKGGVALKNLWELPLLLGKAILLDKGSGKESEIIFKEGNRTWQINYHIDPDTKVYYLKTAFVKKR